MKTAFKRFLFLFFFTCNFAVAQQAVFIDSLKNALVTAKEDTLKADGYGRLAAAYVNEKKYGQARQYADSCLRLSGKLNHLKGLAMGSYVVGYLQGELRQYDSSHVNLDRAISISRQIGGGDRLAKCYQRKGDNYRMTKQYGESIVYYKKSIEVYEGIRSFARLPVIYQNLAGVVFDQTHRPDSALPYEKKALDFAVLLKNTKQIAISNNNLGKYYQQMQKHDSALFYFEQAYKYHSENNDKAGVAMVTGNLAILYKQRGEIEKAIPYYQNSIKDDLESGEYDRAARNLRNLALAYTELGNKPVALKSLLQAVKICEDRENKTELAICYSHLASFYSSEFDDTLQALKYGEAASRIFYEINDRFEMAEHLMVMAQIYEDIKDFEKADSCYHTALPVFLETDNKKRILMTYNFIAWNYKYQNRYTDAIREMKKSLHMAEEIDDKIMVVYNNENLGSFLCEYAATLDSVNARKTYLEAKHYLERAMEMATEMRIRKLIHDVHYSLSQIDSAMGNYEQALKHYKLYTLYKDSITNEESNKQVSQLKIQFETEKKDKEIALLNKDNEIKSLQLIKQEATLRNSRLEAEKNQTQILLLNTSNELQQLSLSKTQQALLQQQTEAKAKEAELEVIQKDKQLNEQQLEKQRLLRNGILMGVALLLMVALLTFRSIQLKRKLEKQQAIAQERKRISADLHDDIGSGLSKISLLSEKMKREAQSPQAKAEALKIADTSHELSENISEIIWALNSKNDYLENLVAYIRRYAGEYFENSPVSLKMNVPRKIPSLPITAEVRRNIFYTVKEALHNIVKHSKATRAELTVAINNNRFAVIISDNGKGIPEGELNRFGNGLSNMKTRMKHANGDLNIQNHNGTTITLSLTV